MLCPVRPFSSVVLTVLVLLTGRVQAQQLPQQRVQTVVPPLLDDAGLNDVQFVGTRRGFAVGDRGVIWRTDDGGQTWQLLASGVDCSLRSISFLTDRVGWVVGGGITPHVGTPFGVVLGTEDGGDTWTLLVDRTLPLLHTVRFFDMDNGRAVCEATARFPSGVLLTSDGGTSWQPLTGPAGEGWRTGDFVDEDMGFVAGRLGRFTSVGGNQVMPPLNRASGLRSIVDCSLGADGRGWLAGDGGLVLTTENGGISWRPPAGEFPRELRDVMDFRAVSVRGNRIWLAGMPGSVVWHSADGGQTWASFPTGSSVPINSLTFASDTEGWAVGALGTILVTQDGGESWTAARGANRRVAVLAVHAHASRVSFNLVTRYGGEEAYRTAVTLMARRDIGPDGEAGRLLDLRLHDAVTEAGGAASAVDWAFPVAAPELDHHTNELIREWQLLTDNRLREVMLTRLLVQLRTWRPDVLIVDSPPPDDATTTLLADALKLACVDASTDSAEDPFKTSLYLTPWQVKRAYRRLPAGSEGNVAVDAFEVLPRLGSSLAMAAAHPISILNEATVTEAQREAYDLWTFSGLPDEAAGGHFFAGLVLQPGGDARRRLADIDDRELEKQLNLANQQRNFTAYARRHLDDERHAAQLIGQTKDIIGAAPPEQAVVQLAQLADEYRRRGQWEHAQTTLFELVDRYHDQPAALEAMRWLFLFTSSAEVSWQRQRSSSGAVRTQTRVDENIVQANVAEAIEEARAGRNLLLDPPERPSAIQQTPGEGMLRVGGGTNQQAAMLSQWQGQAARLKDLIRQRDPAYFAEASMQFPVAALERSLKHPREADAIVDSFLSGTGGGPWNRIAAGEVWIRQPSTVPPSMVALCHRTAEAPYLDGELSDACWVHAVRIPLRSDAEHQQADPLDAAPAEGRSYVQLAYDDGYLYVAAHLPRAEGVAVSPVEQPGRTDDADLSGQDRLSLQLDTDRDYATCYEIAVDQRGWSADACWDNEQWNAQRYIAVSGHAGQWLLEMAIPFAELVPQPPQRGETWAAGLVRILPTAGVESWSTPAGTVPHPEGFGLVQFE